LRRTFEGAFLARITTAIRHGFAFHNGAHAKFKWQSRAHQRSARGCLEVNGSFAGKEWAQNLDLAEFAINGSESSATGLAPFFANLAREPRVPANLGTPNLDVPSAEELADAMFATITHTRNTIELAKRKYE